MRTSFRSAGPSFGFHLATALLALCACNASSSRDGGVFGSGPETTTEAGDGGDGGDGSGDDGGADDGGTRLDVGYDTDGGGADDGAEDLCKVQEDGAGVAECDDEAPPDSFEPEIQWVWSGDDGNINSITTPLVANLTDDNDDGEIDLCDVPDVVVLAGRKSVNDVGYIYVLSGDTGEVKFRIEHELQVDLNPVIGDIDNDGLPEIVAGSYQYLFGAKLIAFEHDGTFKWEGDGVGQYGDTLAMADIDNDGDVEIYGAGTVYDHLGTRLFTTTGTSTWAANTAADLDGDGDLEVVSGKAAVHHTGDLYYLNDAPKSGYPQVANLDDDPHPEVLLTTYEGFWILEHDGTTKVGPLTPTGDPPGGTYWERPAAIHDFDGDGLPEFAMSSAEHYATYERDGSLRWMSTVQELSGIAAGTAFDFLGDGSAEAMYADETTMYIFNDDGDVELSIPRTSSTLTEFPIVADVDNDGSAEIVVTSNLYGENSPTVQVIRDVEDRWVQARRIWNQHAYHVTNVNEDGTIPQFEKPNWETFNTFRTNAQIEGGQDCVPPPEG